MTDVKISLLGCAIGCRRRTNKASYLRSCRKRYLKAYSTEHAKDLRTLEEAKKIRMIVSIYWIYKDFITRAPVRRNRSMLATLQTASPAAFESGNNYPRRQTLPVWNGNVSEPLMKP
jgi:hypothetical protein